jgi:hypothetical protein
VSWVRQSAAVALAVTLAILAPTAARADGDPASDVLIGTNVFFPYSPPVSNRLEQVLTAETSAGARAHFPIKVALIASPVDLGTVPGLFGKPQEYADFLDQEISFLGGRQLLLVVMAAGYGVAGLSPAASAVASSLPKPAGSSSNDLARAAIAAVPKLAAAAGHPIASAPAVSAPKASGGGAGGSSIAIVIAAACVALMVAGAIVLLRVRRGRRRGA